MTERLAPVVRFEDSEARPIERGHPFTAVKQSRQCCRTARNPQPHETP